MKKHAMIALILVLTTAMLAGCRNPNDTTTTTAATTTAPMTQPTTAVTTMPTSLPETSESSTTQESGMDGTGNTVGDSGIVESEGSGNGANGGNGGSEGSGNSGASDTTGSARGRSHGGMQGGR